MAGEEGVEDKGPRGRLHGGLAAVHGDVVLGALLGLAAAVARALEAGGAALVPAAHAMQRLECGALGTE